MIDKFATNISTKLVHNFPDEMPSLSVTRYGIKFILSNVLPITLLVLIGLISNMLTEIVICITSFSTLRMVSGGYHAKNPEVCLIISTITIVLIAKFGYIFSEYSIFLCITSMWLVFRYAPSNIKNQTKILEKHFKYLKVISILIIIIGFIIDNYLITASLFVQSTLLIRRKGGGNIE